MIGPKEENRVTVTWDEPIVTSDGTVFTFGRYDLAADTSCEEED